MFDASYLTASREFLVIIGLLVAGITWLYLKTKNVSEEVVKDVTVLINHRVEKNADNIAKLRDDLDHHKRSARQEANAFASRFDKLDENLRALSTNYVKATKDLDHYIEISKIESKQKMDAMNRIEKSIDDSKMEHRQWVDQITKSLREASKRSFKDDG